MDIITIAIIFSGIISGILLILSPRFALWALLVMTMIVCGPVIYFVPRFSYVQWAAALISYALLLRALASAIGPKESDKTKPPLFMVCFITLLVSVLLTTIINRHFAETIITAKNFFQFWSIPLAFYFLYEKEETARGIMKAFLIIAILQTPIAFMQRLFFAGKLPGDSVTGTFGGHMLGGGPNVALSIFLTLQVGIVLSLVYRKLLAGRHAALLCIWFVIPVFLTNSRAIIVFYLVMMLFLFGRNLLKRPFISLASIVIVSLLALSIFTYHYKQAAEYNPGKRPPKNLASYLSKVISHQLGVSRFYKKDELNRMTALLFWWQEQSRNYGPIKIFFGHGLGSSKYYGLIQGHIQKQQKYHNKRIGLTALSRLLWDIGLVGTLNYILIFTAAFFAAGKLSKHSDLPDIHKGFMAGAQLACLFFLMSMPYKISILSTQAYNAFSMFMLGYIAFWYKKCSSDRY